MLLIQTILIFLKLEQTIDPIWLVVLTPVWIFDIFLFLCVMMWFYFLSKGLIREEFADVCLSGWLKDVLNVMQMGHVWIDYLLFAVVNSFLFFLFPLLLVFQVDIFSVLYHFTAKDSSPYQVATIPWTLVLSPIIISCVIILSVVHRRMNYIKRFNKYHWLPITHFLVIEFYLCTIFFCLLGLHLDGLVPEGWRYWMTFSPLFVASFVSVMMIGGAFKFNEFGHWVGGLKPDAYFMAQVPLISLITLFLVFLVVRLECIATDGHRENFLFSFCYLFAVESLVVLYWLQDIVDYEGYMEYDARKKFDFSLSYAITRHKNRNF